MKFDEFKRNVEGWAKERGIYEHSTIQAQLLKTLSELGELADAVIKDDREGLKDAVGDVAVCIINYARMRITYVHDPQFESGHSDCITHVLIGDIAGMLAMELDLNQTSAAMPSNMMLCLAEICQVESIDFYECCEIAWNEIKDRKGKMVAGGAFVKECTNE